MVTRLVSEELWLHQRRLGLETSHHMEAIARFCDGADLAVEFGLRNAVSTVALLASAERVISVDVEVHNPKIVEWIRRECGDRWELVIGSSLEVGPWDCDVLMIDSLHNYEHVRGELARHGDRVGRRILFHDTVSHGDVGQTVACSKAVPGVLGIRPAIDEFLIRRPSWRIVYSDPRHSGLLVIERQE